MSEYTNYDAEEFTRIFEQEIRVTDANYIAGLLHVHSGKALKDLHLLDAGCGTGQYTKALIDLGVGKISLVDASSEMLKVAIDKVREATERNIIDTVTQAKIPPLPFDDDVFDAVLFSFVLQDLEKPENRSEVSLIEKTLLDTKRILRPNGLLVIKTWLPEHVNEAIWYTQIYPPLGNKLARYFPSSKEWADAFAKCGFEVVSAMNSLTSDMINHFDPEGPLREEWRLGSCSYACADDQDRKSLDEAILDLKEKGLLRNFMEEHDRIAVMGFSTFYVCRSV